jgi:large subunit ribosomal protein L31
MKSDIHPDYHEIFVIMTNGQKFTTRSTYGKAGSVITLEVDCHNHPAWQKGKELVMRTSSINDYEKKYGARLFGDIKKLTGNKAPAEEKKEGKNDT